MNRPGLAVLGLLLSANTALAADHVVAAGDVPALIAAGTLTGGDRLVLGHGSHGTIEVSGLTFDPPVVITAKTGATPQIDRLVIRDSTGVRIEGLTVIPEAAEVPRGGLVTVVDSRNIRLHNLTIASARDSTDWTAEQWRRQARTGIMISGTDITVTNSTIRNVRHGIASSATNARVEGNTIELFSGDGIRGLGDGSAYIGNSIETCVKVDNNHDDGFQSWSLDAERRPGQGIVRNVLVEGNRIVNGDHPLACQLQGIGLFDGIYEDWTIKNNIVLVDHWHGITVMGARNVTVSDNTVLDSRPGAPGPPWISITSHKDGRPPEAGVISRNVTMPWSGREGSWFRQPRPGVTLFDNRVVRSLEDGLALGR